MIIRSALIGFFVLAGISALQARPVLEKASPASGEVVRDAPSQIALYFSEALVSSSTDAVVRNVSGGVVSSGKARVTSKDGQIKVPLTKLPPGKYRVEWYVTSAGNQHAQGSYNFVVGTKDDLKHDRRYKHRNGR